MLDVVFQQERSISNFCLNCCEANTFDSIFLVFFKFLRILSGFMLSQCLLGQGVNCGVCKSIIMICSMKIISSVSFVNLSVFVHPKKFDPFQFRQIC